MKHCRSVNVKTENITPSAFGKLNVGLGPFQYLTVQIAGNGSDVTYTFLVFVVVVVVICQSFRLHIK